MFDVKKHLITVQGGRKYLPVAYRLIWFREDHPDWGISTKLVELNIEKGVAIFHATVTNDAGIIIAEGHKMETARGFGDYVEKAETGAIGRALGILGYGTQFATEFDEALPVATLEEMASEVFDAAPEVNETRDKPSEPLVNHSKKATESQMRLMFALAGELGYSKEALFNAFKKTWPSHELTSIKDVSSGMAGYIIDTMNKKAESAKKQKERATHE